MLHSAATGTQTASMISMGAHATLYALTAIRCAVPCVYQSSNGEIPGDRKEWVDLCHGGLHHIAKWVLLSTSTSHCKTAQNKAMHAHKASTSNGRIRQMHCFIAPQTKMVLLITFHVKPTQATFTIGALTANRRHKQAATATCYFHHY